MANIKDLLVGKMNGYAKVLNKPLMYCEINQVCIAVDQSEIKRFRMETFMILIGAIS